MLRIKNLNAGYGDSQILKDISLELTPGTISVLMGPNGAGKSTLLKSIFNLTTITGGTVSFQGSIITGRPTSELIAKGLAFVSQGKINFGTLTVRENLLLGARFNRDTADVTRKLNNVYGQFPVLKEKSGDYAFSLSGGQQQMLAMARALMSSPKLLLLDEPSLGLAPKLVREVFQKIKELRDAFGVTVLIVEHNIKSLMDIADYGYILVQGSIVAHDTCSVLKNSPIMKQVFVGALE